jgi:predicted membrane channel-forming protein YqfA (hemolysin III family)
MHLHNFMFSMAKNNEKLVQITVLNVFKLSLCKICVVEYYFHDVNWKIL